MPEIFNAVKEINPGKEDLTENLDGDEIKIGGESLEKDSSVTFIPHPFNFRFVNQEKDEEIILLLRRHLITNFGWLVFIFLFSLIPIFAFGLFSFEPIPLAYRFMGAILWYLFIFAFGLERFLTWFFNINIITNKRVIDVDFPNILHRDIAEARIGKIQDINSKTIGFIRSLLNYGDVYVQTAGSLPNICFEAVPYPGKVSEILNQLMKKKGFRL